MGNYELTLVLRPSLTEDAREKILKKIEKLAEEAKGKAEPPVLWGKKVLAYPIKKEKEGVYTFFSLSLEGGETLPLERKIRMEEGILRHLLVRKN